MLNRTLQTTCPSLVIELDSSPSSFPFKFKLLVQTAKVIKICSLVFKFKNLFEELLVMQGIHKYFRGAEKLDD